jgi:tetratricopeptide (TPR) repeat protein
MKPNLNDVGLEVLHRVESRDFEGARRLLDWIREDEIPQSGEDPLSGSAFVRLWAGGGKGDDNLMRSAAASLLAEKKSCSLAIPILLKERESTKDVAIGTGVDLALVRDFNALEKYDDLLPVSRRLLASAPDSERAFNILGSALSHLKHWQEAEKLAKERLDKHPDDPAALRFLASIAENQGELTKSKEIFLRLIKVGKATAMDYNSLAWFSLCINQVSEEDIQAAQRSALLSQNREWTVLHTLASLYAETGKSSEARDMALQSLELSGKSDTDSSTWYVLGRIAENYGFVDAAAASYRKVKPPEKAQPQFTSCYMLAQRRLAAIIH